MILLARAFNLVPLLLVLVVVGFVFERATRIRQARHAPKWVSTLDALGALEHSRAEVFGGKAQWLARAARLGAPVPDAVVLTHELVERVLAATAGGKHVRGAFSAFPAGARRDLEAFLGRLKGKIVVRASFTARDGKHSYAGVFPAMQNVDPRDSESVVAAILAVVASADDAVSREYRRRRGASPEAARAVIIQRQVEPDVLGALDSRGPCGRADQVTMDFARKRSPTRSLAYDLVKGSAVPIGRDEAPETSAWMHRLAVLAVVLEVDLGSPVHVDFAIEDGQPYVLDVRPFGVGARKTWVHETPLDASGERRPTFAEELRGGLPLVRKVLSGLLARAGAAPSVREEEVRYVDGLVYFDAEVLRRALGALGTDVLLRGGLSATLRSVEPIRRRPLPAVPTVTQITASAWHELRQWQDRHLLGAAEVRLELVAREWLIQTLFRLVDGLPASSALPSADRRGHPALRWVLLRRLREASEEAGRQRTVLEHAETELTHTVARLLARGAPGWDAMFTGDRHLHATLEEIDRWHEDLGARDSLESEWKRRGSAFAQRKGEPPTLRVHRPALPEGRLNATAPTGRAASGRSSSYRLQGIGLVPGVATGPAVLITGKERGLGTGAILLLAEPRPDLCPLVFDACGIVLLAGGLVSKVATLCAELGVPVVLSPDARSVAMQDVTIDGTTGTISGPP